jgi:copper chaperone CopZ
MIVGSITAGLLFDFVLPVQVARNLTHHDHTNWLSVVCSAVMVSMIVCFAADDLKCWWQRKPATSGDLRYRITGMNCENCAAGLEREFKEVAGVESATVSFSSEEAMISGNPLNQDILQVAVNTGCKAERVSGKQFLAGDSITD